MASTRARSRPQSRVSRSLRANWMASAVPQEPAPSTAIAALRGGSWVTGGEPAAEVGRAACPSVLRDRRRLLLLGERARVQGFEVHRRQQELRETSLGDQLRDGRAGIGEQHPGADAADRALRI